jgi:F-type H+-transporting ATPase subunit epsilon
LISRTLELEVVTLEKLVVRNKAEEVQIPGKDGYLGILPDHAPLITELGIGENHISGGRIFEALPNRLRILAETAERAEEIDVRRADQAKNRAGSD